MAKQVQIRSDMGQAALTYREIQAVIAVRYGWYISNSRVQQICSQAEAKLRVRLANIYHEEVR